MDCKITAWNIRGLGKSIKQIEVRKLIRNEKLCVCAILETHMKKERIQKIGDRVFGNWSWQHNLQVFGNWSWQHNLQVSRKDCRIMVGWDNEKVQCNLIHYTEQTMFYYIEVLQSPIKFYCTFIYATNSGRNRKELWKDFDYIQTYD